MVTDPDDPRIEPYRAVRERDLAGRDRLFILEGRVVLEKALAADAAGVVSLLVAEPKLAGMADVLARVPAGVPVYAAGQAVMDAIVGFPIHRGVLALGRRRDRDAAELVAALPDRALVVGLVGIANHDNMGGLFRNAAAFGAAAVLTDATCCDPLYRKAIRVGVGASLVVPFAQVPDGAAMVRELRGAAFEVVALSPAGGLDLAGWRPQPRTAVLFGSEGPGLPSEVLTRARTVRIPMAGGFDSLNVATACGIVLHHAAAALYHC